MASELGVDFAPQEEEEDEEHEEPDLSSLIERRFRQPSHETN